MEKISGEEEKIVRREFRVPVGEEDHVRISVRGEEFPVRNLSARGVQIIYFSQDGFRVHTDLEQTKLLVRDREIEVRTRVVYTTSYDPDRFVCGLYFYEISEPDLEFLEKFILEKRRTVLKGD
ncbi:MAG: PilZ domain-containing protein [Desulfonatronovibrionaceae bacterium]